MAPVMTRRKLLAYLTASSAGALLAACAPPTPTATPQPAPTQAQAPKPAATTAPAAATTAPQPTTAAAPTAAATAPAAATTAPAAATTAPQPTTAAAPTAAPATAGKLGHSPAPAELDMKPSPIALPLVSQPLTLTCWIPMNSVATSVMKTYNDNEAYKLKEKRTGIHIDFQHPAVGQEEEQLNLLLASGKYPDIIHADWSSFSGGLTKVLQDGVIIKLNDLISQYAPYYKKLMDTRPDWRKQLVTDAGDMLDFPCINGDVRQATWQGPMIRKDWLDKVGLKVPTTIDEWHNMLTVFKEKHPSGKPNDIAFTIGRSSATSALSNGAFVGAWGIPMAFYQDKGTVKFGPVQPAFKDFLTTMSAWYKEGLVDPDYVTSDQKTFDAKVTDGLLGSFVANTGSGIGRYLGLMASKDPKFDLVGAPYPVLKAGDKPLFGQRDPWWVGTGSTITTANKHVKETVEWLDWNYGSEGWMAFNFGIEGVSYKMVDGYPKYTEEITKNSQGWSISQALTKYSYAVTENAMVFDIRYFEQYSSMPQQVAAVETWSAPTNEMVMPPVSLTTDEASKYAKIMGDVDTRLQEAFSKVVTGAQPVSSWDQVVQQLNGMGIADAVKLQQAALDRYSKR